MLWTPVAHRRYARLIPDRQMPGSVAATEELSRSELRVLRYLPTNPVQAEIASERRLLWTLASRTSLTSIPSSRPVIGSRPCWHGRHLVLVRSAVTARGVQAQTTTRIMKI